MNIAVKVQLGFWGASGVLAPIWLDAASVGSAASWSGSYHVLSMGRHFDAYAVTNWLANLPPVPGFPLAHPYERLAGKIRAAGVTGNIGESIAALIARRYFGVAISDIAHVKPRQPFRKRKAPDYLMRLGARMPGPFAPVTAGLAIPGWPTWMPVESKARSTDTGVRQGRKDALDQLSAYWALIAATRPAEVGFGMAVTFNYQAPREILATLFVPRHQPNLITHLTAGDPDRDVVRQTLYGC